MKWLKFGAIGLAGIIVLAVVVLLALGQRADASRIRASVEIDRPAEQVWMWIEDPDKLKQWVSWAVEVKDEGPQGVGRKRTIRMKDPTMGGQIVEIQSVCREHAPPRKMVVDLSAAVGFKGTVVYQLEDTGAGRTRLSTEGKYTYSHWLASLMEPIVTPQARAKNEGDLRTLKQLLER